MLFADVTWNFNSTITNRDMHFYMTVLLPTYYNITIISLFVNTDSGSKQLIDDYGKLV